MKKLAAAFVTTLFALSIGCGDNLIVDDVSERDTIIDIVPHAGEALTAIESAESLGFGEAIYFVELDIISMVGDPGLVDQLGRLPGVSGVFIAQPAVPDYELVRDLDLAPNPL